MAQLPNYDVKSPIEIKSLPKDLQNERTKQLEDLLYLTKKGVSEDKAKNIISFEFPKPVLSGSTTSDLTLSHKQFFSIITLNAAPTRTTDRPGEKQEEFSTKAAKFSVYAGNGYEPRSNKDQVYFFDITDDDQNTIAAQFHVTPFTTVSTKNLIPNGNVLSNRSAVKARADVIELKGNEMIILKAGDRTKNSIGARTTVPGGVHIYAGDNTNPLKPNKSQPMVLGDNLQRALEEIYKTHQSLSSAITDINTDIMKMKLALAIHFHVPCAPGGPTGPSPTLAVEFPVEMISQNLKNTLNSVTSMLNHKIEKINRITPISKTHILSRYNTVN
jgi:hypothetical protein